MSESESGRCIRGNHARLLKTLDDQTLLCAFAQSQDEAAFAELSRRYFPIARLVAMRVVRNAAFAEDAAQQAMVALARSGPRLIAYKSVEPWLRRTAMNKAKNLVRSEEHEGPGEL